MDGIYEAIVTTTDGTFRAFQFGRGTICVIEDGLDGIVDYIQPDENVQALSSPESMLPVLISWVFEMRRGLEITNATLSRRDS